MGKSIFWWAVIWIVIGAVVYAFVGKETPEVIYGVAAAAGISFIFMMKTLSEQWEGEIIEVKKENVFIPDDDGGDTEERLYAYVRLSNGKTKKIDAFKGYEVGNYLIKKRGEGAVKIYTTKPA